MATETMDTIPARTLVWNGPVLAAARGGLGMSRGKMTGQAIQVAARATEESRWAGWFPWTTTIVRAATTERVWERVKDECEGYLMVDEGYTEVEPGTETCFLTRPYLRDQVPAILRNAKCPLMGDDESAMLEAFLAGMRLGAFGGMPIGNSNQETRELQTRAFKEWLRASGR
jgi:peptidyl-tRNA hydrolase